MSGTGDQFEDRAAEMLLAKGYTLLTRRFRSSGGEIDIIALDGQTLVFVEVKYRKSGHPENAVGSTKIARCAAAAEAYLRKTGEHRRPTRFDLVAITEDEVRHYQGAFRAP